MHNTVIKLGRTKPMYWGRQQKTIKRATQKADEGFIFGDIVDLI